SFLLLLLLPAAVCLAQPETATLRGTVTNASGEPLPEITIIITEASTNGDTRHIVTGKSDAYEAPFLKAAPYKITIQARGYQDYSAEDIVLQPGEVRRVDPQLTPGAPEETTAVQLGPSLIDTQTGTIRGIIDNKVRWNDAPVVNKTPSPFPL